jgi:hypothetical protein
VFMNVPLVCGPVLLFDTLLAAPTPAAQKAKDTAHASAQAAYKALPETLQNAKVDLSEIRQKWVDAKQNEATALQNLPATTAAKNSPCRETPGALVSVWQPYIYPAMAGSNPPSTQTRVATTFSETYLGGNTGSSQRWLGISLRLRPAK